MVVLLLHTGLRALRRAPPGTLDRGIAVGFLGCAVAFVAVSAASNVLSNVATLWYLMVFAAVAGAAARRPRTGPVATDALNRSWWKHGDSGLSARGP